ncbi:LacI family DNA-binding transcriptional regulator [Fodinisporobacter ferrooxydans]|uniref:LacI family DNA-binding transcriptional regulator n=1 Tax=Fodinisporobacter ferrooxydans TaxID=2901836 RepID=A0ABY4CIG3_9BACL|nr:LacI family DNA-binding transcriptional regulator [Alicyclobacillaceae bacterium MYW30-H2]
MRKKNINASDVAKFSGVSQSTVSRVFTPGANVSEKTRRRVLQAANELGYHPNAIARGLITQKTNMIGIAMGDVKNPFYAEILGKFSYGLRTKGYHVLFVNTDTTDIQGEEVSQFLEYNVDGVIITDALLSSSVVTRFLENDIPVVLFNRYIEDCPCSIVCCDNILGGTKIGEHFLNTGHQRLAFIAGKRNTSTSKDREKGFREALRQKDLEPLLEFGEYTYHGGYAAAVRLLQMEQRPDGIFCANDIMALGALDAAKQLGIKVPDDVSIIGFDDIGMSAWPPYSLTTWQQPVDFMIQAAIDILIQEIDDSAQEPQHRLIQGGLIARNSVQLRTT